MFAARYFAPRYFAPRYWPKVGADPDPVTGGAVWVFVNGESQPPGTHIQGSQVGYWMCLNGAWVKPNPVTPAWPRRARSDN